MNNVFNDFLMLANIQFVENVSLYNLLFTCTELPALPQTCIECMYC